MRKLIKFMLLLVPMVLMMACSSDDDSGSNYNQLIIGKWTSMDDPGEEYITFKNDGKVSATNVEYNITIDGTYQINGSKVKIDINSEITETEIIKIDELKLEWKVKDEYGDYTEAYIRVP
jgi:uncharacterized protein (TIGR03066 family)